MSCFLPPTSCSLCLDRVKAKTDLFLGTVTEHHCAKAAIPMNSSVFAFTLLSWMLLFADHTLPSRSRTTPESYDLPVTPVDPWCNNGH